MTFKMKNMKYWKAKNAFPGINNDFEKGNNLPDGRSKSSPFQQEGPLPEGNIKLQPTENPDTALTGGKGAPRSEKIADLEDRIEFLQSDLEGGGQQPGQDPKKIQADIDKLKQELAILRARK